MEHPHILDIAQQAMRDCDIGAGDETRSGGVEPMVRSCQFMGLPCPNLFTGGYNQSWLTRRTKNAKAFHDKCENDTVPS